MSPAAMEAERTCRQCKTLLSRYNDGEVCGPCGASRLIVAAADPVLPKEIWERSDVREALAAWDLALVCRLIRVYTGLSQEQLAHLIGRYQSCVSMLESGARQASGVDLVRDLVEGLGIPTELLGAGKSGSSAVPCERNSSERCA